MRQFRLKRSSETAEKDAPGIKDRVVANWRIIFVLSFIVAIALIMRVFFAYDYAVSGGFALSGGSDSAYHLRVIEHIMETGKQVVDDAAMNYPFGERNVNPFLMDWTIAAIAKMVTLFGVSASTAATGTLVIFTAILGALTCIPIYFLGKEMFGKSAGIIAAVLYAICSIVIANTVLSNGTEAAFYGFFFVLMVYFLFKAVKAITNENFVRKKGEFKGYAKSVFSSNKQALIYALAAGVMLAVVALSWNGFRPIVLILIAIMIVQVVLDRIRKRDPTSIALIYSVTLLVGMLIALPFYIGQGLWDLVFSGSFVLALVAVAVTVVISETKGHPWLLVIPIVAVITAMFFAVLFFISPEMFSDVVSGNSIYLDQTFLSLVEMNSSTSLSEMAGYYGWMTIWLPYILIAFMIYKMPSKMGSVTHMFILVWLVAMMAISWSSSSYVFLAAPAYVIGGGALIARIIKKADIKSYFSNFKGTGFHFKSVVKKLFKPLPFLTIMMAIFLVGAPNAIYAIDASISTNEKADTDSGSVSDYFGALGYYVHDEDWKINNAWDAMSGETKSGALVTWWDYGSDAITRGGFNVVSGFNGAGTAAASNILLSDGSSQSIAAMALRLIDHGGLDKFKTALTDATNGVLTDDEYNALKAILDDPSAQIKVILDNPATYGKFSQSLTAENAMYISAIYYLCTTAELTQSEIIDLYNIVCDNSSEDITYIAVSGGMFPIAYGDGSVFSTLAYMNNYALDENGAPTQFYTVNSSGYMDYTSAMYNSVLWKTYIGPSPSDYGYTSAIDMFNAFSLSDGSENTKAQPGFGMPNYTIAYWHVMYNADPEATLESDGWVEMDAADAMAEQELNGGLINYMSGLPVVLEYIAGESTDLKSGKIVSGATNVKGVRIAVFDEYGIQRNTTFTDADGNWSLYVPYENGKVTISVGSTGMTGGLTVNEFIIENGVIGNDGLIVLTSSIDVGTVKFAGKVFYDDSSKDDSNLVLGDLSAEIKGTAHGMTEEIDFTDGEFTFTGLFVPDEYTITIKDDAGNTITTGTYEPTMGRGGDIQVELLLTTATININAITDEYGAPITTDVSGNLRYVTLTSVDALGVGTYLRTVALVDGKAEVKVIPGTYTASMTLLDGSEDPVYELFNISVTAESGKTGTISGAAQLYAKITVTTNRPMAVEISNVGATISTLIATSADVKVPRGLADNTYYVYGTYMDAGVMKIVYDKVELATNINTGSSDLSSATVYDAFEFTRTVKTTDGNATAGSIRFYDSDPAGDLPFISAAIGSDGKVSAWLPAGDYTIHAYSSSTNEAYLESIIISGHDRGGDLNLVKAKTLTVKVLSSVDGDTTIPFVPIQIHESEKGITIGAATDGNGLFQYKFPDGTYDFKARHVIGTGLPGDTTFTLSGAVEGDWVKMNASSSTTTITGTFKTATPTISSAVITLVDAGGNPITGVVIEVEIRRSTDTTYTKYSTDDTSGIVQGDFAVGKYDIRVERETGFYYKVTSITMYPDSSAYNPDVDITVISVNKITLTDITNTTDYNVSITALDDVKGTYLPSADTSADKTIWYLQSDPMQSDPLRADKSFQIKVTDKDNIQVWYYNYNKIAAAPELITVDLNDSMEIEGYVGYNGSGTIEITYDSANNGKYVGTVSGGKYTAVLPKSFTAYDFDVKLEKYEFPADSGIFLYEYSGERLGLVLTESGTVNLSVITYQPKLPAVPTLDVDDQGWAATTNAREFEFNVTVVGNDFMSLFLSGGSGWEKIEFFGDTGRTTPIDFINGDEVNPVAFYVRGTYKEGTAYDSSSLSIIFKNAAGETVQTHEVTGLASLNPTPVEDVTIGRGSKDNVSESESNLSIMIKNDSTDVKTFTVSVATGQIDLTQWLVVFTDSTGKTIRANDASAIFEVKGMTETVVYVKFISAASDAVMPTTFEVEVTATDTAAGDMHAGDATTLSGTTATITMTPYTTSLDVDGNSASGSNIFNSGGSMPVYVWVLVGISILTVVLILWLGMKRGVFSRKK